MTPPTTGLDADKLAEIVKKGNELVIKGIISGTDIIDFFEQELDDALEEAGAFNPQGHYGEGQFSDIKYCDVCHYQIKPKDMCECPDRRTAWEKKARGVKP